MGLLDSILGSFIGDTHPTPNDQYLDENGNPIAGQKPYSVPGWATRFFHPDVASYESEKNLGPYNAILDAQNKLAATKALIGQTDTNPQAANIMAAYGGYTGFANQQKAKAYIGTGAPTDTGTLEGMTDTQNAATANVKAQFDFSQLPKTLGTTSTLNTLAQSQASKALNRSDVIEAGKDSDAVNQLSRSLQLDPLMLQHSLNDYRGMIGRDPTFQELQDYALNTEFQKAKVERAKADTMQKNIPAIQGTMGRQIKSEEFASHYIPGFSAPFMTQVGEDGTVTPNTKVPYFNPMLAMTQSMQEQIKQNSGAVDFSGKPVTTPDGKPLPMSKPTFDSATGKPTINPVGSGVKAIPAINTKKGFNSPSVEHPQAAVVAPTKTKLSQVSTMDEITPAVGETLKAIPAAFGASLNKVAPTPSKELLNQLWDLVQAGVITPMQLNETIRQQNQGPVKAFNP